MVTIPFKIEIGLVASLHYSSSWVGGGGRSLCISLLSHIISFQAEALKEQSSSRVKLNVTIHAPMVVLPLSTPTQSALVANLGSLTVTNVFCLAADIVRERHGSVSNLDGFLSPTRQPAIVDKMTITLTEIQFGR